MNKTYQNKFGNEGNCLSACIASILEVHLNKFPDIPNDSWISKLNEFLICGVCDGLY